jgi:hypothetical protein
MGYNSVPEDQMDTQVLERLENDKSHVEPSARLKLEAHRVFLGQGRKAFF